MGDQASDNWRVQSQYEWRNERGKKVSKRVGKCAVGGGTDPRPAANPPIRITVVLWHLQQHFNKLRKFLKTVLKL